MRKYCKAYHLRELRQFSDWEEKDAVLPSTLADDSIVYLWDDYTVVTSPIHHNTVLFQNRTPQWEQFCTQTLQFSIPEDIRFAYTQPHDTDLDS